MAGWSRPSRGAAVLQAVGTLGDLLKSADQRLYAAQRGGRNRVVAA